MKRPSAPAGSRPTAASRRDLLKSLGVAAAAASFGTAAVRALSGSQASASTGYFTGLVGAGFGGCTVTSVGPSEHGGMPIELADAAGRSFTIDVLRHDDASPGVARAGSVSLYTRVGRSPKRTDEGHGLATMALAEELQRREQAGRAVPKLCSLEERAALRSSRLA